MDWSIQTLNLIRAAIDEDLDDAGDATAGLLTDPDRGVFAHLVPRRPGVICGLALGSAICAEFSARLDCRLTFTPWHAAGSAGAAGTGGHLRDGAPVRPGQIVAEVHGPRAALLTLERTLLNFLCRMSGVATLTQQYVTAARAANPTVKILDTRKTLPGWRELDKYAVRCGGGENHRFGLFDAVLIKDNHLAGVPVARLAPTLREMLARLRDRTLSFIEVEVDSLDQLREILGVSGINIALLDNFTVEQMREAVKVRDEFGLRGKLALEASGGVTLETVAAIAATGIDRISIGALTHSAPAVDIGLDFVG